MQIDLFNTSLHTFTRDIVLSPIITTVKHFVPVTTVVKACQTVIHPVVTGSFDTQKDCNSCFVDLCLHKLTPPPHFSQATTTKTVLVGFISCCVEGGPPSLPKIDRQMAVGWCGLPAGRSF